MKNTEATYDKVTTILEAGYQRANYPTVIELCDLVDKTKVEVYESMLNWADNRKDLAWRKMILSELDQLATYHYGIEGAGRNRAFTEHLFERISQLGERPVQ